MNEKSLTEIVGEIIRRDERYAGDAYIFLFESLDFLHAKLRNDHRQTAGLLRHVTAAELAQAICDNARREFGPLAHFVFATWGVHDSSCIGDMVYNLIAAGKLAASESDKRSDFDNLFTSASALGEPYRVTTPPTM